MGNSDQRGYYSDHSDSSRLALGLAEVVESDEDVQDVFDDIHPLAFDYLQALLTVHHFPLVFALEEHHQDLGDVAEDSHHVLEQIHLHTARVVCNNCIFGDELHFPEKDSVIA